MILWLRYQLGSNDFKIGKQFCKRAKFAHLFFDFYIGLQRRAFYSNIISRMDMLVCLCTTSCDFKLNHSQLYNCISLTCQAKKPKHI